MNGAFASLRPSAWVFDARYTDVAMWHILVQLGATAGGEIVKRTVSGAIDWAKGRRKPSPEVIDKKVRELVTDATKNVVPESVSPEDRQALVSGLIDVVRPTLDEVMKYSPNTQRIAYEAGRYRVGITKATAAKRSSKKVASKKTASPKHSAKYPATKKAGLKRAVPKRVR